MVTAPFPHLAGLAAAVRVALDDGVPTMGVFASGRLVANRGFTMRLSDADLRFVLAHELLHLALRTHDRAVGSRRLEFNFAHDYIINDMLRDALGLSAIPAGGLDMPGARHRSAEEIVLEMRRNGSSHSARTQVFEGVIVTIEQAMGQGGEDAGDVLDAARERRMFPGDAEEQEARARAVRDLARRGMAMAKALGLLKGRGAESGGEQRRVRALRGLHHALAGRAAALAGGRDARRAHLHPRLAPGRGALGRGAARASPQRHAAEHRARHQRLDDGRGAQGAGRHRGLLRGGRRRRHPRHPVRHGRHSRRDALARRTRRIRDQGLWRLRPDARNEAARRDHRVTAAIIITDGDVTYPPEPTPYAVLWAVPGANAGFAPPYGRVVTMQEGGAA